MEVTASFLWKNKEKNMNLTLKEIAAALNIQGEFPDLTISSVEFDSRLIRQDGFFVPLAGERDGHTFADKAVENGAVASFWSHSLKEAPNDLILLPVADVTAAFQQLAVYYQTKIAPKVVAITGSNGKTTTKDMTESVLAQKFQTYKTQGNYNNDLGMPYTILHMPSETQILILEMGMDHQGEIAFLSELAKPDAAAITLIGEAHLENLGSRQGIAAAKMEIVTGLKNEGLLLIPANEPLLKPLVADLPQTIQTFGVGQGEFSATILTEDKERTTFEVDGFVYEIPVLGSYNVTNALIAYGFGQYFGLTPEEIARGLARFQLTKNRTQWLKAANGADILSDVYNANPTAMGLVLDSFGQLLIEGRRFVVLADMLELGPDSKAMHVAMKEHLADNYQAVFLYGSEMKALADALIGSTFDVYHFEKENKQALMTQLKTQLKAMDALLLKGSNGMGLIDIVTYLQIEDED